MSLYFNSVLCFFLYLCLLISKIYKLYINSNYHCFHWKLISSSSNSSTNLEASWPRASSQEKKGFLPVLKSDIGNSSLKTNMTMDNPPWMKMWRCISYWKWWFSSQSCYFSGVNLLRVNPDPKIGHGVGWDPYKTIPPPPRKKKNR